MKKVLSAVLALGFVFAVYSNAQAQSATDLNGIKITGDVSLFFGGLGKSNKSELIGTTNNYRVAPYTNNFSEFKGSYTTQSQGMYQVNLNVIKTFENESSITIHLKAANDSVNSLGLGNFRPDVNDAAGPGGKVGNTEDNLFVNEVFYTLPLDLPYAGKTVIVAGYTGAPGSDNNLASSMGSFFTGDPTVLGTQGATSNPYGAKISITPIPLLTFTYGYFTQFFSDASDRTMNDLVENAYNVAVLNFTPIENGNYRIGYWESASGAQQTRWYKDANGGGSDYNDNYYRSYNNEKKQWEYYYRTNTRENPRGLFLSFDQMVGDIGFFARYGKRIDSTLAGGPLPAGQVFQIGTKISGAMWGRDNDSLFFGFGMAWLQEDALTSGNYIYEAIRNESSTKVDNKQIKPENHIEINYGYSVFDNFKLTPFFQYVWDIYTPPTSYEKINGGTGIRGAKVDDYGYAGGVRLSYNF